MINFIDAHREDYGVEPICKILQIAPSTWYDHQAKRRNLSLRSDRDLMDEALQPEIKRVFETNHQLYGVRKVWHALRREGFDVARCTVARLMRDMGLRGAVRGKKLRTTVPNSANDCPLDLVNRKFVTTAPNRLWVADFTYVSTWAGFVYVAFIIDVYARRLKVSYGRLCSGCPGASPSCETASKEK